MNKEETLARYQVFGCQINFVETGHSRYVRGFVIGPTGTSLGRITMLDGHYDHVKWYSGNSISTHYICMAISQLLNRDRHLSKVLYEAIMKEAEVVRKADLAKKKAWRYANPKPARTDGSIPSKRRPVQGRCLFSIFSELLSKKVF